MKKKTGQIILTVLTRYVIITYIHTDKIMVTTPLYKFDVLPFWCKNFVTLSGVDVCYFLTNIVKKLKMRV